MTRDEEKKLQILATNAKKMRKCIDDVDSLLRTFTRHKKFNINNDEMNTVNLTINNKKWYSYINLPINNFENEIIPILKRIRNESSNQLKMLDITIGETHG